MCTSAESFRFGSRTVGEPDCASAKRNRVGSGRLVKNNAGEIARKRRLTFARRRRKADALVFAIENDVVAFHDDGAENGS